MKKNNMNENPTIIAVETEALELRTSLTTLAVVDQATYDRAVDARVKAKAWLKDATEYFDNLVKPAYESYKNLLGAKKSALEPVENAIAGINRGLLAWDQEQERIRLENQRRVEREARERAEAERLAQAEQLQAAGASAAAIDIFLDEPVIVTEAIEVAPTYEKRSDVLYRDNWSGEVTDLKALVKYIAKNPTFLNLIQVNQTAVNQLARSMKGTLDVPGIKPVNKKVVASSSR